MGTYAKLKVGVLTSSRADYGIYLPLLKKLNSDPFFDLEVIAFGTHLLESYGHTVDAINKDGFRVAEIPGTMSSRDLPVDIAHSMSATLSAFSDFFNQTHFQLMFALGDRYEMFSAVVATAPFNIPVAHIHGGETTIGAIDNYFRHSITCFSKYHFTAHEVYYNRVIEITGERDHVYNVGALSIDNLSQMKFMEASEFQAAYGIDVSKPSILFTFHPETVNYKRNKNYIAEILNTFKRLENYQIIATMPNADTEGRMIRNELIKSTAQMTNLKLFESLGSLGYLSAMKYCSFMLGNTSSGFIEASYFPKPVINLGERQRGRIITPNIYSVPINSEAILQVVRKIEKFNPVNIGPIYGTGKTAEEIIRITKAENINN